MGKESRKSNHANRAIARGVRIAPRKARIVADLVRNKPVDEALNILMFTPKKAAPLISGLIENALHSVELSEALDWDIDDLVVSRIVVDEGPTLRRFRPRAMGRATRINKRTSHITVELSVLN